MNGYDTLTYPKSRLATFDVGRIGHRKHHIAGFLEIDVTVARERLKARAASGARIGFTAWMLKAISRTIADNRQVHAINHRGRSQIAFHDVDISMPIEREVDGQRVPLPTVIRGANTKSVDEIHGEIQAALNRAIGSEEDYVLETRSSGFLNRLFFNLPQSARMLAWRQILRNPFSVKENMGTVIVTNVGMMGKFPGWIFPKSIHNLCFGVGSIIRKPWVVNERIEIRDILHLTVLFEHDVVDGAPAARFADQLVRNLESAIDL